MGVSAIQEQRDIILGKIRSITGRDWKVLVVDEASHKIIENVVSEDDILNQNITNIERIEDKRPMSPQTDAIYIISPEPYIVECLLADLERQRYRKAFLMWTALLDPQERRRIDSSPLAKQHIGGFETLSIDFFPRESHLITFRDPWSFPILYHPACNSLVVPHMKFLAQKIIGICVSLGEYPRIRYYKPRQPIHEASVLCKLLAGFVQDELDAYAQWNPDFPPPSTRPQGTLFITDRSMDIIAPLVHEFTYQAMAHDLLPIREGDKVFYKTVVNEGTPEAEEKDMEIGEKDEIWVKNRHTHMKDTIEKLMGDFQNFINDNPHFTNQSGDATSLNAIKDMLAGLPQFQSMKEAYSLHLSMAQECMNIFQQRKLPDIASVEQSLATGLDEEHRKPKNLGDQVVRLLDDESLNPSDRLRLIMLYIIHRYGVIREDIERLIAHASLPAEKVDIIMNLDLLGARATKNLKDVTPPPQPLFPRANAPTEANEEYSLSRFEPALKFMLEEAARGTLDQSAFPYTKPPLDQNDVNMGITNTSLRSGAKPTWAQNRRSMMDSKPRIIVFVAGGATYSESRVCYESSRTTNRDVFLATSHMLNPSLFTRQIGDLSVDRRRLDLPPDRPPKKAPAHIYEREAPKPAPAPAPAPAGRAAGPQPPTAGMGAMNLGAGAGHDARRPSHAVHVAADLQPASGNGRMEQKPVEKEKEKKKRGFFGSKK